MTGVRLESEAHIITGLSTSLKNLAKCINDLGVKVDGFVFSGLAAAEATLTETEKELGVVAFDIGAGTSSFCVYTEGVLEYSGALPIGARHITQDIAVGCRISLESAEKIKLALDTMKEREIKPHPGESKKEFSMRKREADKLDLDKLGIADATEELSRSLIVKRIMYPRMQEIFTMLGEKLDQEKLLTEIPAGLVISGGGANTVDINLVAKKVLGLPTRTGKPEQLVGLVGEVNSPAFATSVGLLVYGRKQGAGESMGRKINLGEIFRDLKLGRLGQKLLGFLRKLLP
jgi:cell division protein FtsA